MAGAVGAAPPAPIFASVAGLGTPDEPVELPAAHALVTRTAFLGWQPAAAGVGGVARVALANWQMLVAFGARLSASQAPADLAATRGISPLGLALVGACWTRVLNEYLASGLLACTFSCRSELTECIIKLTVVNPAALVIVTTV